MKKYTAQVRALLKKIKRLEKRNKTLKALYDEQLQREDKVWELFCERCEEMDTTEI